jgi:hypothetical protein
LPGLRRTITKLKNARRQAVRVRIFKTLIDIDNGLEYCIQK